MPFALLDHDDTGGTSGVPPALGCRRPPDVAGVRAALPDGLFDHFIAALERPAETAALVTSWLYEMGSI